MFDTVFGLPVHVLVIHGVVVLVPLTALVAVIVVLSRTWRERLTWPLLILAVTSAVVTLVAVRSGEAFAERLDLESFDPVERHQELGENARIFVLLFVLAVLVDLALARWRATLRPARIVSAVAVILLAVLATVGVVMTGHTGSEAVWKGVVETSGEDASGTSEDAADAAEDAADDAADAAEDRAEERDRAER